MFSLINEIYPWNTMCYRIFQLNTVCLNIIKPPLCLSTLAVVPSSVCLFVCQLRYFLIYKQVTWGHCVEFWFLWLIFCKYFNIYDFRTSLARWVLFFTNRVNPYLLLPSYGIFLWNSFIFTSFRLLCIYCFIWALLVQTTDY